MSKPFVLDSVIAADTTPVVSLPLCELRLMKDSNYPWLLLIPRRAGMIEMIDLAPADRAVLIEEIALASEALRANVPCDKLNVAALGNAVRQLHIHVVARRIGDVSWPRTIWGARPHRPYDPDAQADLVARLKAALPGA